MVHFGLGKRVSDNKVGVHVYIKSVFSSSYASRWPRVIPAAEIHQRNSHFALVFSNKFWVHGGFSVCRMSAAWKVFSFILHATCL